MFGGVFVGSKSYSLLYWFFRSERRTAIASGDLHVVNSMCACVRFPNFMNENWFIEWKVNGKSIFFCSGFSSWFGHSECETVKRCFPFCVRRSKEYVTKQKSSSININACYADAAGICAESHSAKLRVSVRIVVRARHARIVRIRTQIWHEINRRKLIRIYLILWWRRLACARCA